MAKNCPKCGRSSTGFWCECGQDLRNESDTGGNKSSSYVGSPQMDQSIHHYSAQQIKPVREKGITIILALILGGIGVHRFYLGNLKTGLFYLLFCWTFIPVLISFVEILLIVFSPKEREQAYGIEWKNG